MTGCLAPVKRRRLTGKQPDKHGAFGIAAVAGAVPAASSAAGLPEEGLQVLAATGDVEDCAADAGSTGASSFAGEADVLAHVRDAAVGRAAFQCPPELDVEMFFNEARFEGEAEDDLFGLDGFF